MASEDIFVLDVSRRIGGLEISKITYIKPLTVSRRIGGLENKIKGG